MAGMPIFHPFSPGLRSGIIVEEVREKLEESEVVDIYRKTVFAGHDRALEHMNSQQP